MDSFEILQKYMMKESNQTIGDKEEVEARKLISKVKSSKGNTLVEKAKKRKYRLFFVHASTKISWF